MTVTQDFQCLTWLTSHHLFQLSLPVCSTTLALSFHSFYSCPNPSLLLCSRLLPSLGLQLLRHLGLFFSLCGKEQKWFGMDRWSCREKNVCWKGGVLFLLGCGNGTECPLPPKELRQDLEMECTEDTAPKGCTSSSQELVALSKSAGSRRCRDTSW